MAKYSDAPLGSRSAPVGSQVSGSPHASPMAWVAVAMVIVGMTVGAFALVNEMLVLWIITAVALVVGGILMVTSNVMDQAH